MSWTEGGSKSLSEGHLYDHEKENRENMVKFQEALKAAPPRDYNKLKIAYSDLTFLKTRGIKIDDDIEYDPTVKYEPYEGPGMSQRLWRQILEKFNV